jgi:hypothetical protein
MCNPPREESGRRINTCKVPREEFGRRINMCNPPRGDLARRYLLRQPTGAEPPFNTRSVECGGKPPHSMGLARRRP